MEIINLKNASIIVADEWIERTLLQAEKASTLAAPVLICGESGTGKELVAKFIHEKSKYREGPYISINSAAIPEGLLEAELFGFEKGAFTGAISLRVGKFEKANNGSLLLDEISELPLSLQAKLLRVLQEGEIDRLGGNSTIKINTRILATTNLDPVKLVNCGKFRKDLYFRLNVIRIDCAPLREREKAIVTLAKEFVNRSCIRQGIIQKKLTDNALKKLVKHNWPGNVRELQNVVERAVLFSDSKIISEKHIHLTEFIDFESENTQNLSELEEIHIKKILNFTNGNKTKAAKLLGVSVRTLRNKLHRYGM